MCKIMTLVLCRVGSSSSWASALWHAVTLDEVQISHRCIWTAVTTGSRPLHSGTERACSVGGARVEPTGWAGREPLIGRRRTGRSRRRRQTNRCSYRCRSTSVLTLHCMMGRQRLHLISSQLYRVSGKCFHGTVKKTEERSEMKVHKV